MTKPIDTRDVDGITVNIYVDEASEHADPLDMDCVPAITYGKHSRYVLGDTPLGEDEHRAIGARIRKGELIGLAVHAYIHSGIALSARRTFNDIDPGGWDSAQSGWVYAMPEQVREWWGVKRITKKLKEKVLESFAATVEEYGRWLNGEVYGYVLEKDGEELDSCWGFIGIEYAVQEATSAAKGMAVFVQQEKQERWRAALREARERRYWAQRDVMTVVQ